MSAIVSFDVHHHFNAHIITDAIADADAKTDAQCEQVRIQE